MTKYPPATDATPEQLAQALLRRRAVPKSSDPKAERKAGPASDSEPSETPSKIRCNCSQRRGSSSICGSIRGLKPVLDLIQENHLIRSLQELLAY